MRIAAPATTPKAIWDHLLTEISQAGSIGLLLEDNVDSKISLAKADLTTLESRLSAARAGYLDNLNNTQLLNVPNLSTLSTARIGYLDNVNQAGLLGLTALRADGLDWIGQMLHVASDTLLHSNDAEKNYVNPSPYAKVKEVKLWALGVGSELRILFDLKSSAGDTRATPFAKLYQNGGAVGTERSTDATTYQTFTEDLSGWDPEDLLQVYGYIQDPTYGSGYVQNLRIKGDEAVPFENTMV